ncbi:hypothetical protein COE20_12600 [Bacillus cereus]|nr:hypothetical protein CON03_30725 [Bacillus cereus]PFE43584.1 hypothetical protein CN317_21975 [Bacillus cereus]PFN15332.1 hypothetical protein COJ72_12880 [Bacillus cereus]PGY28789.1 hypothetical protein COE20_12600 [Bacillus cereus]
MIVFGNCVLATMSFIFTIVPPFCFKLLHTYIIIFFLIFNLIIFHTYKIANYKNKLIFNIYRKSI